MNALIAVSFGAFIGLGVLLIIQGIRGRKVLPDLATVLPDGMSLDTALLWSLVALFVGVGVFVVSNWPVAAVGAAAMVMTVPAAMGGKRGQQSNIERTQAIASWAEMIRDNMAGAAGLEQALQATTAVAPAAIAPEVQRFASRLDRMNLLDALAALGDDLDHPSADLIVVSLANAAQMEARELGPLLSRLADSIRADVRMRLRVEVGRTRIRTSARVVVGTTIITILFLFTFSRDLLRPYDKLEGQLWMCVVAGVFVLGGFMLKSYGNIDMPERFSARRRPATQNELVEQ